MTNPFLVDHKELQSQWVPSDVEEAEKVLFTDYSDYAALSFSIHDEIEDSHDFRSDLDKYPAGLYIREDYHTN